MTTAQSPIEQLKKQADTMAKMMKMAERGDPLPNDRGGKIAKARRESDAFKVGIAMDDKFISIEMHWAYIRANSEAQISAYILKQMSEARSQ